MQPLQNQRFLVAGGAGIGLATAVAAARAGAIVPIASRSEKRLSDALRQIGGSARAAVLDMTDNAAVARFFADPVPRDHAAISAAERRGGRCAGSPANWHP